MTRHRSCWPMGLRCQKLWSIVWPAARTSLVKYSAPTARSSPKDARCDPQRLLNASHSSPAMVAVFSAGYRIRSALPITSTPGRASSSAKPTPTGWCLCAPTVMATSTTTNSPSIEIVMVSVGACGAPGRRDQRSCQLTDLEDQIRREVSEERTDRHRGRRPKRRYRMRLRCLLSESRAITTCS